MISLLVALAAELVVFLALRQISLRLSTLHVQSQARPECAPDQCRTVTVSIVLINPTIAVPLVMGAKRSRDSTSLNGSLASPP